MGARPDPFDTREPVLAAFEEAVNSDVFTLPILNYFKYKQYSLLSFILQYMPSL